MPQRQKVLFSTATITAVPRLRMKNGHGKTKTQLYEESRDARDKVREMLAEVQAMFEKDFTPEHYANILAALSKIKSSAAMGTLLESKSRDNPDYYTDRFQQMKWYTQCAEEGLASLSYPSESWIKYKMGDADPSTPRDSLPDPWFTCCGIRAGYRRWVFQSNRGRTYCLDHFETEFSAKRVKITPERFPKKEGKN